MSTKESNNNVTKKGDIQILWETYWSKSQFNNHL